jgi:hypothetical protein
VLAPKEVAQLGRRERRAGEGLVEAVYVEQDLPRRGVLQSALDLCLQRLLRASMLLDRVRRAFDAAGRNDLKEIGLDGVTPQLADRSHRHLDLLPARVTEAALNELGPLHLRLQRDHGRSEPDGARPRFAVGQACLRGRVWRAVGDVEQIDVRYAPCRLYLLEHRPGGR